MGNIDSAIIAAQDEQLRKEKGRFVINFISATDIPAADFMSNCEPYLKAYICKESYITGEDGNQQLQYIRLSDVVQTPRKTNCTTAIWNSYRDFHLNPPSDSFLMIELYDINREKIDKDPIGSVAISVEIFTDELPHNFLFNFNKVSSLLNY